MTTKQNKKSTEDVPGGTDFDISVFCSVFVYISVLSTFQMVMSCVHGCPRSFSSRYPCLTVTVRRSPSLLQYHAHSNGLPNACTSRVDPLATNTAVFIPWMYRDPQHSIRSSVLLRCGHTKRLNYIQLSRCIESPHHLSLLSSIFAVSTLISSYILVIAFTAKYEAMSTRPRQTDCP